MISLVLMMAHADAAAPPLRLIFAQESVPAGASGQVQYVARTGVSKGGLVYVQGAANSDVGEIALWLVVDGVAEPVLFEDGSPASVENISSVGGPHFAGERLVWAKTDGNTGELVLFGYDAGGVAQRLIGSYETIGTEGALGGFNFLGTDTIGNTLLGAGGRAVFVNSAGEAQGSITEDQDIPGADAGWHLVSVTFPVLNDDGEVSVMVQDADDNYGLLHGPWQAWGVTDLTPLMPDDGNSSTTEGCCDVSGVGATGFHVLTGGTYDFGAGGGYTQKIFRGLPGAFSVAFEVPPAGIDFGGGVTMALLGGGSWTVGEGGAFAQIVEVDASGESVDALVVSSGTGVQLAVKEGDTVGSFTIGTLGRICGITDDYVIFDAAEVYRDGGVFAWPRNGGAIEAWYMPGARIQLPDKTVDIVNVRCDGPSRVWEQDQATVWMEYETAPGNSQYRALIFDGGGVSPVAPDLAVFVDEPDVVSGRQPDLEYGISVRNLGTVAAEATVITIERGSGPGRITTAAGCQILSSGARAECTIGTLAAGADANVTFTINRQPGDSTTFDVVARSSVDDAAPADNFASFRVPGRVKNCATVQSLGGHTVWLLALASAAVIGRRRRHAAGSSGASPSRSST